MSTLYRPNTWPNPVSHLCKIIATLIVTGFGFELIHFEILVLRAKAWIYTLFVWPGLTYKPWLKVLLAGLV